MKKIFLIISIGFLFIQSSCNSSTTSDSEKQLLVQLNDPSEASELSGDNYQYQMSLYLSADNEMGELAFGPVELSSYNVEENLYSSRIDNILDGSYFIEVNFVQQNDSTYLTLANLTTSVEISGNETTVNLSGSEWLSSSYDDDEDGLSNISELIYGTNPNLSDTDQDGVLDSVDAFPISASASFDFDNDGLPDSSDNDADNDGLTNSEESDLGTNAIDSDSDDDSVTDGEDNCPLNENSNQTDTDSDDQGDSCDSDIDNDGLTNDEEDALHTDQDNSDTDNDGVLDGDDSFPTNSSETSDNDGDGSGNNTDSDDDNDGLSDSEETSQGSDPNSSDTDSDGVQDNIDNCVLVSNAGQPDNENDGVGDDCDDDDDNDELIDTEESSVGEDGFITNSDLADSDGDGFEDSDDNCPLDDNIDQTDTDVDGFGDECDCAASDNTINQLADDLPDPSVTDSNCDGIDGNKYQAVFVSSDGITEATESDMGDPTSDLNSAITLASELGYAVHIAAGDYNIAELALVDGVSLYGGFSSNFLERDTTSDTYATRFVNSETNDDIATITIDSFDQGMTLAGIQFENQMADDDQTVLHITDSTIELTNNKFVGNSEIESEILVEIENSSVTLNANQFFGLSSYQSTGLFTENSTSVIKNNIFSMGSADHTKGISIDESETIITNNTIDGGSHESGTAFGIITKNSSPTIINNIILTENDRNQASVYCNGGDLTDEITLQNNLMLRYTTEALTYAAYVECDGSQIYTNENLENSEELDASDNIVDSSTDISDLSNIFDTSNYFTPVSGSSAIDAGQNTDNSSNGEVLYDFLGTEREPDAYDIGASEYLGS